MRSQQRSVYKICDIIKHLVNNIDFYIYEYFVLSFKYGDKPKFICMFASLHRSIIISLLYSCVTFTKVSYVCMYDLNVCRCIVCESNCNNPLFFLGGIFFPKRKKKLLYLFFFCFVTG